MTLRTRRLFLRPITPDDVNDIHNYACNLENVTYMLFGPNTEQDTKAFVNEVIHTNHATPRLNYDFAVILTETGEFIGTCGIYLNKNCDEAHLSWILNKRYWQKGYGTELASELLRFGFEDLKAHRILATCDTENYGSYRVMERNHMRREAHFKKNKLIHEQWRDEFLYAILHDEWLALNQDNLTF